ncbi:MAG: mycothiol system anti-sigma-R factor [Acidobacteria bacterium]|nr:mycothiol system anti-sigma-R factor [Acidobacteriota bacterium]
MSTSKSADSCNDAVTVLHEYLDGELTDQRRNAIITHLDDCSGCFSKFEFEQELRAVVANHCRTTVPDELRAAIIAEIGI